MESLLGKIIEKLLKKNFSDKNTNSRNFPKFKKNLNSKKLRKISLKVKFFGKFSNYSLNSSKKAFSLQVWLSLRKEYPIWVKFLEVQ